MAYTRTEWVSGETPLSADNMNNIEDGIEEVREDALIIPNGDGATAVTGLSDNTSFTAPRSGWLVVMVYPQSGITMEPFLEIRNSNGTLASAWGNMASSAPLRVSCPVKKGKTYTPHWVRATFSEARIFY